MNTILTQYQILIALHTHESIYQEMVAIRGLYELRRKTKTDQLFWNQFWHKWDKTQVDAYRQAHIDIAHANNKFSLIENQYDWEVRKNANFEQFVARDQYRTYKALEAIIYVSDI